MSKIDTVRPVAEHPPVTPARSSAPADTPVFLSDLTPEELGFIVEFRSKSPEQRQWLLRYAELLVERGEAETAGRDPTGIEDRILALAGDMANGGASRAAARIIDDVNDCRARRAAGLPLEA